MRGACRWVVLVLAFVVPAAMSAFAQTQSQTQTQPDETRKLQEQIRQLEQLTQELKARIAALESEPATASQPAAAPQVVDTTLTQPAVKPASTAAKPAGNAQKATSQASPTPTPAAGTHQSQEASGAQQPTEESDVRKAEEETKKGLDIYGFAMLDLGYQVNQNDPDWFDVMRPTKLPASFDQFGRDGRFYAGVRQSRFGVKGYLPTPVGELKTIFEFELFGVGVDAGQTTFRLRHAWGEIKHLGAGQSWSPFMDPDVFPNSLEYWGPNGMVFFRNVQLRWMPVNNGNHQLWFALERPGASGDPGTLAGRNELQNIRGRFPAPDVSARLRFGHERDYLQIAAIGRYIAWDQINPGAIDLSSHTLGWGVNVSVNLPGGGKKDVLKLEATYGHGIENYMNDAPVDVAPIPNLTNLHRPINGEPLPVTAYLAFYDKYWGEKWSTSLGYSYLKIDNTVLQTPSSFHKGQYGLINLLHYPVKNVMFGGEFQWGRRDNFADGFQVDDYRIQFGFRYNFDYKIGYAGEK
ncbi:MAG TPA: DcaP family trimeric outer membrane transporter [Candidatus Sulfotelmatobacter sp.]|nr:DcaP family trimeric outer membrane transporter [Candidatus Sulfotelmatobacter sp.]